MAFCFIDTCRPVTTYHLYCSSIRLTYLYSPCGRVQSSLLTTHGTRIIKRKLVIDTGDQIHFKKRKLHFPLHLWNLYFLPRVCCAVIDTLRFSLALRKMISRSLNLLTEDQFWQKFKNLLLLQFFDSMTTHNIRQIIWWSNFGRMFLLSSIFVAMWLTWLVFQSWVQPLTAHLYLTFSLLHHVWPRIQNRLCKLKRKTGQFPIYVTHLLHNLRNVSLIQFCSVVWAKTHLSGFIQPYSLYKTSTLF